MTNDNLNNSSLNPGVSNGADYSYNDMIYPGDGVGGWVTVDVGVPAQGDSYGAPLSLITEPTATILLTEGSASGGGQDLTWGGALTDIGNPTSGVTYYGQLWDGNPDPSAQNKNFDHRHTGGSNILWYDGHAKWARSSADSTPTYPSGGPYYWYLVKPSVP